MHPLPVASLGCDNVTIVLSLSFLVNIFILRSNLTFLYFLRSNSLDFRLG